MISEEILIKSSFHNLESLKFPCPTCITGTLTANSETLLRSESKESIDAQSHPEWEPEWINCRFSAILKCNNCNDAVSVCGWTYTYYNMQYDPRTGSYKDVDYPVFNPLFFFPALKIFVVPSKCPENVRNEIEQAFSLFWNDFSACVNRLRTAIELIMDDQKVKKTSKNSKGQRVKLTLHRRIVEFNAKDKDIGELLLALKWIGNTGSHVGEIERQDLIHAFQLLEYSLIELYEKRTETLRRLSKKIIKSKKPISHSVRKRGR